MIDHESQLSYLSELFSISGHPPLVFLKIDTGYHRAGVEPSSPAMTSIVTALLASEAAGHCVLYGLYSHNSNSYGARSVDEAVSYLSSEFNGVRDAARIVREQSPQHKLVLSAGASPDTTTVQNPGFEVNTAGPVIAEVADMFRELRADGFELEVHAGVYPTLDLQQLSTHARNGSLMSYNNIAISVLVEVGSLYPGRGIGGTTEALVTAGTLALGREPVADKGVPPGRDYSGWGIVTPWNSNNIAPGDDFPRVHGGWQIGRISQEHGILAWKGAKDDEIPLHVGQRLRIWPNHACIAGAGFDHYLIVDSRKKGSEDEVIDVWSRWRGW
jgi:D-serine deaminase-like pyridoxal phosphate-dependent protein